MLDPYQTPSSHSYDKSQAQSAVINTLALLMLIVPITLFNSWVLVPKLNGLIAGSFHQVGSDDYWSLRYTADIFNTFMVYAAGAIVSVLLTRNRPFLSTLPIGFVGLGAFLYELGGLDCLGVCGPPLWYDVLSFFKHFVAVLIVAVFFRYRRKHQTK
jgi:hypothetical protein